ncbi:MAG: type II toxin-antitoxin system HicB family antitoxin [Betaproteobacteria bacterium]
MRLTGPPLPHRVSKSIALNPATGTTTQDETIDEAVANLKEATSLYLDEFPAKFTAHPLITTFDLANA